MIHRTILILLLCCLLSACGGEFRPDPVDPRIPVYSEENNRVAGAFINGIPWRYVEKGFLDGGLVAHFNPDLQELSIEIRGDYVGEHVYGSTSDWIQLYVSLDQDIQIVDDLNDKIFVLDGEQSFGSVSDCNNGIGRLYIRNAEARGSLAHLSGTFFFNLGETDCDAYLVNQGRFDIIIQVR